MAKSKVQYKHLPLDSDNAQELVELVNKYLGWMQVKNYTPDTLNNYRKRLHSFIRWCEERKISKACEVTRQLVERYQGDLAHATNKTNGQPLSMNTRSIYVITVIRFLRWLTKENLLLVNPADGMRVKRMGQVLPKNVLTHQETEQIIAQPDITTPLGVRNRAILETLYSTGIRARELIHLTINDIDLEQGMVAVLEGKGRKDRLIPIGQRAVLWLEKYLHEVRSLLAKDKNEATLFLTVYGKPFSRVRLSALVRRYVLAANIGKKGACHMFRHAMATAMLENGADIRYIQEMLGHVSLSTTAIYTKVAIGKLKEIHRLTHPSEKESDDEPDRQHL